MKITDIRVDGFGVWSGLDVDELSDKLTLFYGPNEAGKTTLMQFVRTVLYGFSSDRRRRYLPPIHGGAAGGVLGVRSSTGSYAIGRNTSSDDANHLGQVAVTAADGTVQGQHQLTTLLTGVDESIFNNVFAIGLRELQELGSLNDTEAADQLYKLTTGVDRVSLVDVMRGLTRERRSLLAADDRPSEIVALMEKKELLERELEDLSQGTRRWTHLAAQREAMRREVDKLELQSGELERESRLVEIGMQVHSRWLERDNLRKQIQSMGAVAELPIDALDRIKRLNATIRKRRGKFERLQAQRQAIKEEALALPINRQLWSQVARIEALGEHAQWIASLQNQIERVAPEVADLENELQAQRSQLAVETGVKIQTLPDINSRTLNVLRAPARAVRDCRQRLKKTERRCEEAKSELERETERFELAKVEAGCEDFDSSMEQAGDRVGLIRRRIQVEQKLEKMTRRRDELEDDRFDLMEDQVLHPHHHLYCGVAIIGGAVLLTLAFFFKTQSLGVTGMIGVVVGLLASALGFGIKFIMERNSQIELENCERQLRMLNEQIDRAAQERDEIDRHLPKQGGAVDSRLQDAEQELKSLESLVPMKQTLSECEQRYEQSEARVDSARREVKSAEQTWKTSVEKTGLPGNLSPKHVRQVASACRQMSTTRKQIDLRREELEARDRELTSVTGRIEQLLRDVDVVPIGDAPQERLNQLAHEASSQRQLVERRTAMKRQFRQLSREAARYNGNLRELNVERASLLDKAGVSDEDSLHDLGERFERHQELSIACNRVTEELASILGGNFTEEELEQLLRTTNESQLESRWERLIAQLQESQGRFSELHQQMGAHQQEMKSLAEDRRLAEVRLELNTIERQLRQSIRRWQVLSVSCLLLESTRKIYESDRQPETLREASRFLKSLTDGQYTRVWTPLTDDILYVDDLRGESLSVDVLSRGTREAVFLSLRLALASAYARRGAMLPLVLDDVLVNLDVRRAKSAVRVLREFAKEGHQLLLFTCHEHITKLFKSAKVEVRLLPSHLEVAGATKQKPIAVEEIAEEIAEEVWEEEEEVVAEDVVEAVEADAEDEYEYYDEDEVVAEDEEAEDAEAEDAEAEDEEEWEYEDEEEAEEDEEIVAEDDEEEYEEDEYEEEEEAAEAEEECEEECEEVAAAADDQEEEEETEAAGDGWLEDQESDQPLFAEGDAEYDKMFTWESPDMWNEEVRDEEAA
ncbi:MAG: AAA family ATPase [Pirellulaceae bacterium]|nr:AAA family ATPase [Pirellulaceae bacterium]